MVEQIGEKKGWNRRDLAGLSTDTKLTEMGGKVLEVGSTFYEADTQNSFIFVNDAWWSA